MSDTEVVLTSLRKNGIELWAEGDSLRYRAPKGVVTSTIRAALEVYKPDLLTLLTAQAQRACTCEPIVGAAYVSGRQPTCPACCFIMRCGVCNGCRWCRSKADGANLPDKATVDARRQQAQDRLLERLLNGQKWLADALECLLDMPEVGLGSHLDVQFSNAVHLWERMDNMLRELFNYQDCIRGEGQSCPDSAPGFCRYCLAEVTRSTMSTSAALAL